MQAIRNLNLYKCCIIIFNFLFISSTCWYYTSVSLCLPITNLPTIGVCFNTLCFLCVIKLPSSSSSSSSSALQLFMSFGLLNYFFPFVPLLRRLFPIIHSHLPQVIPHVVLPSYSWPSLRSCCIRFPFVHGLGHFLNMAISIAVKSRSSNFVYFN